MPCRTCDYRDEDYNGPHCGKCIDKGSEDKRNNGTGFPEYRVGGTAA